MLYCEAPHNSCRQDASGLDFVPMRKIILIASLWALGISNLGHAADYKGLGAESVKPEVLSKYSPPEIPSELSRKIQILLDQRAAGAGRLTPDGKKLFYSWAVTGSVQVWRLDGPNTFPVQMTGGEDRTTVAEITPDGKKLILQRDRSGEENPGLYWQNVQGGPLHLIQHAPKVQTRLAFTSEDSKRLYFLANDVKDSSYAIYRYEFATGKKELLFSEDGIWSIADRRPDEKEFLLSKHTGNLYSEYFIWRPSEKDAGKKLVPLVGQGEKEEYYIQYSAHEGEYLVQTPKLGNFRRVYRMKGGKLAPLSGELAWDISEMTIDDARKRIYLQVNENGYTRLMGFDAKTYKPLRMPAFPDADHVTVASTTHDGRFITLAVESAQSPRTNYVYDWQNKKLTRWITPSSPEVDLSTFPRATLEHYSAADGTKIPMFVRRPPQCATEVCPVIVSFHGGPESQSTPGFNPGVQMFIEAGFVFVEPNVRGSDGYGKAWLNSDNGAKRLDVITDIRDCAAFVKKTWSKNGQVPKVGVIGGSYGGYSTQVAMSMFAGSYDAGFSVVGMSDLRTFLLNTAPYRRILRISEYGDPEKDVEALKKLSPITYVSQVKAPMFFLQGLNDPRVPAGEAIQMHETLIKNKVPSQLVIFPDEGHGAGKRVNQVRQYGYALDFFTKYLR
jgi:dipeptidyl aminopeptidase/acylaminoacyl peptidase